MVLPMTLALAPLVTWMPIPLPWIVSGAAIGSMTGTGNPIRAEDVSVILMPASVLFSMALSVMIAWAMRLTRTPSRLPRAPTHGGDRADRGNAQ